MPVLPPFFSLSVPSSLLTQILYIPAHFLLCIVSRMCTHVHTDARLSLMHRLAPTWGANAFRTFQNWLLSPTEWKIMRLVPKIAAGTRRLRWVLLSLQLHLRPPLWTVFLPPELSWNIGVLWSSFIFGKLSRKPRKRSRQTNKRSARGVLSAVKTWWVWN